MRFDVFTLFPRMFDSPFAESIIHRAIKAGLIEIHTHDIRAYATDKHRTTDDYPFGGGTGMVMKPEPIFAAVESVLGVPLPPDVPIILMTPSGRTFNHALAQALAQHQRIALICGHYEGVDERVREHLCTDAISIGDYVLTGGELAAMVVIDAVARLVPGVLPPEATQDESHASGLLEYPQYTRPAEFRGWRVPEVLLSGNHAAIARWRREQAEARTRARQAQLQHTAPAPAAQLKVE
ncbi:MAG: tRNA (guanosine(37)-N1)-methyltransferase TrmD [Thermoflexales bacterium]|nr:tRNA (guanosine(37)-N1)-methyltransferase TrmD [Thermoflexales bacterium]